MKGRTSGKCSRGSPCHAMPCQVVGFGGRNPFLFAWRRIGTKTCVRARVSGHMEMDRNWPIPESKEENTDGRLGWLGSMRSFPLFLQTLSLYPISRRG
ncbi:hypothetical protein V6N12_034953 [Hibiscus sabdariffa]|uniref:Uncharacterized protein n=1 Tax=Hibiscus sabdariffa TaxID=183260 RepID=A0ABR2BNX9_9ROSI